jgi:FAD binding domain
VLSDRARLGLQALRRRLEGGLVLPGDAGWDAARQAWNLAVDQRPAAVVLAQSAADVVATVEHAGGYGLRVAFNAGGHNAGTIDWGDGAGTLLLKTERMRRVEVDAPAQRVRVEAGTLAQAVMDAAGAHGLCYLAGTSPDVGVVGYVLGGGLSWMARRYGLAANSVEAVELVTADGRLVRADRDHEPDLFWAVRGSGGNFGAVTALELQLYPIAEVYAGALFWPIERAGEILRAWRAWVDTAPDECTSIGRLLQLPEAPFLPEHLRGRSFVLAELAFIGAESDGAALVRPLRALGPELDTVATIPTRHLTLVNMDPDFPLPYAGDGILLDDCPADAIDALVETFVGSPLLHAEVRHLGGALGTPSPHHGCLGAVDEPFVLFTFGVVGEHDVAALEHHANAVLARLAPWDSGRRYLNFTESRVDPRSLFPAESYERLRHLRALYDPGELFVPNHPIPPAQR